MMREGGAGKSLRREGTRGDISVSQVFCFCEERSCMSACCRGPLLVGNHSLVPLRPPLHPSLSLSLGSAVGPLFQGHCGGLSSVAVHSLGCPVNGANRVAHNPSYIFHRAF